MKLIINTSEAARIIRAHFVLPSNVDVEFVPDTFTVDRAFQMIGEGFFDNHEGRLLPNQKIPFLRYIREMTHAGLVDAKHAVDAWDSEVIEQFSHHEEINLARLKNKTLALFLRTIKEKLGSNTN